MGVNISYMGTKRQLAPAVADAIGAAKSGVLLDAFSGMCSVGEEVGTSRQIWTNDAQVFAAEVGAALFTTRHVPLHPTAISDLLYARFSHIKAKLKRKYVEALGYEEAMLLGPESKIYSRYIKLSKSLAKYRPTKRRDALFCSTYANAFFGTRQALEIDAIIGAINGAAAERTINADQRRWLMIALGRTLLRTSTSTGHFAQFLKPNSNYVGVFRRQRMRRVWTELLMASDELEPLGNTAWRKNNKSFNRDSLKLLPHLAKKDLRPSVVYADPPYTDDQYSRYYHVLETMMLYDFPTVTGAGLYRADRFQTPFSLKSKVVCSMDALVHSVAKMGADLVLSYPTNGLLHETDVTPEQVMKKYFRKVERCHQASHDHSTFGASKGPAKARVTEVIYLARS